MARLRLPPAPQRGRALLDDPALTEVRHAAATIAAAVARDARRAGVAPNITPGELRRRIRASQWTPACKRVR